MALEESQLMKAKHLSHEVVFQDTASPDSLEKSFFISVWGRETSCAAQAS